MKRRNIPVVTGLSLGVMLNPLNSSMIALALYSIQQDFALPLATVTWLVTAFYLASMVGQPLMGRLGDMAGHKRLFLFGLSLALLAALGGAWAPTFVFLLVMRIIQSLGTSPLFPCANATVNRVYEQEKGEMVALMATVNAAMAALGPSIGGLAIAWWSWQGIFLVNIPVILLALFLCWRFYPADETALRLDRRLLKEVDLPGVFFFTMTVLCLVGFILTLKDGGQWWILLTGLAALVFFWRRERRTAKPFIDLGLFRRYPMIGLSLVMNLLVNVYYYIIFFGLPLYLQTVMGFSAGKSGLIMLSCAGVSMLVGPPVGRYADRVGYERALAFGVLVLALTGVLFKVFFLGHGLGVIIALMAFSGLAYGALNVTVQLALMRHTPGDYTGMAIGLLQSSRYLGAIGSSVALAVMVHGDMTRGMFAGLLDMMMVAGLLLLALWALARRRHAV
ncbi:MFS transporter [Peptococcus simiae]|uniref:MFS transporter n=1 Tax=Peptococcus simiae TaxID=1643805 RepID=A0ABW9H1H8_9FIRM